MSGKEEELLRWNLGELSSSSLPFANDDDDNLDCRMATAVRLPQQLLRLAIPLVPSTGFTTQTLSSASLLLPSPHTAPAPGYSHHTLQSLFPSAPPAPRKRSLTREELLADAAGLPRREEERLGPAKALVEEWLEEGRRVMVGHLERGGWKGEVGVREGLRERVRWNENVVDRLPDVSSSA